MKTLKLQINERLGISNLLNQLYQAGGLDLQMLSQSQKIVNKLIIDEKERKQVDWKVDPIRNTINWNPQKDKGKEIEFSNDEVKMIKEALEEKNKKKGFNLADAYASTLAEKLGIEIATKEEK